MDIILLILEKPLDKHGTTLVHITYPPLLSVLIFAIFSEMFMHVVGKNVAFFTVYSCQDTLAEFLYNFKKKRQKTAKRRRAGESLATC